MTYYYIYKITNKLNGKIYYGQHSTDNLEDGYMGSGKAILKALKKYGKENFEKKILKFYNSLEELNIVEARLVNERWLKKNKHRCYNLQTGGKNNKKTDEIKLKMSKSAKGKKLSDEIKRKISSTLKGNIPWNKGKNTGNGWNGKHHSEETKLKISNSKKGKTSWNKGISMSEETKRKISETKRLKFKAKNEKPI